MKKVFITTTPLQGKDDLKKLEYVPQQFELAQGNRNTAFPIIPIIAEHLKDMGETEIIVIRMENSDTSKNYQRFVQEVEELGLDKSCIKTISFPETQNSKTHVEVMLQLIEMIPNHSVVRACVTFGTKPIAIIVSYALQCIKKALFDVEVRGIYYGELQRTDGEAQKANLCDITMLLQVGEIIEDLKSLGIDDIKSGLKSLLG